MLLHQQKTDFMIGGVSVNVSFQNHILVKLDASDELNIFCDRFKYDKWQTL